MEGRAMERAPLTGVDRVFKEALYANLRFPQTSAAIVAYTLNALFTDPNPKKLIQEYLTTELSEEKALIMKQAADRAHAAFLPEGEQPVLSVDRMRQLWESDQHVVKEFLRHILGHEGDLPEALDEDGTVDASESSDEDKETAYVLRLLKSKELPLEEIKTTFSIFLKAFNSPDVQEDLKAYRNSFKASSSGGYVDSIVLIPPIKDKITERMKDNLPADARSFSASQQKIIDFILRPG